MDIIYDRPKLKGAASGYICCNWNILRIHNLPISNFMDRNKQDLIANQKNFIMNMVKPCFDALSHHNYILPKFDSIVSRQLEENLLTWMNSRVDDNGKLIPPDKEDVKRLLNEKIQREKDEYSIEVKNQEEKNEREILIPIGDQESLPEDESWNDRNNGLMHACCAPLFSIFRRKNRQQRYRE